MLRIEKGHVAGNEINGTTTARDLGLAALVSRQKDFIGRVLAERPGLARSRTAGALPASGDRSGRIG